MSTVVNEISKLVQAIKNCKVSDNEIWLEKHSAKLAQIVSDYLPSGLGFDRDTQIDYELSNTERLVFITAFHHMDENGDYVGWTDHRVTVRPSFLTDISIAVSGKNKNNIKQHITEVFAQCLTETLGE